MAVDASGNIFVGGRFTSIDNVVTYNIAYYDVTTDEWSPLTGNGLKEFGGPYITVEAMAISGNNLFVAGRFSQTFDGFVTGMTNIARYDIVAKTWHPLTGGGLHYALNNGNVSALAVSEDGAYLFAGGKFRRTADDVTATNLNNFARYDIAAGTWSAAGNGLGQGFLGQVNALAVSGDALFAGGEFTQSHNGTTTNLNNIARLNIAFNTWSTVAGNGLGGSFPSVVRALAASGNDLFVGGSFTQTHNGSTPNLNNIARFDILGNAWYRLAGDGLSDSGFNDSVYSLAIRGSDLFVGGIFSQTANGTTLDLNRIAHYSFPADPATLGAWSTLQGNGLDSTVNSLAIVGSQLFVGGSFTQSANGVYKNLNRVARFQLFLNFWLPLGPNNGMALDGDVKALKVDASGKIYVGGLFTKTLDGTITNLNHIARFNVATNAWEPLAAGGLNGNVNALEMIGDNLYVGGDFTMTVEDVPVSLNRIARYNTASNEWFVLTGSLPNGNGLNDSVAALAKSGDNLFVGGSFTQTVGDTPTTLNRIARYSNSANAWSPLAGNGLNNSVNALAASGNDLFAGGDFSATFDNTTSNLNRIAHYNVSGNAWTATANNGLNNSVRALYTIGNNLLALGSFTQTFDGTKSLDRLAHYDISGNSWTSLTNGSDADAYQAATMLSGAQPSGTDLAVGGSFEGARCGAAQGFTRIYFQQWSAPGTESFLATLAGPDWHDSANWTFGTIPAANSNAVIPAGSGSINITSADVSMNDLSLSGGTLTVGAGRTLTINGILDLNGGIIDGEGTVVITSCKQNGIMGGDAASYIQTTLVRCVNDTGTFNFPVGTANGYSPVTVKNITGNSTITARVFQTNQPNLNPATSLQRYWTLTSSTGVTADLIFKYLQADVSGNENNYRLIRVSGGMSVSFPNDCISGSPCVNTAANMATIQNLSSFSDWTMGEPVAPTASDGVVLGRIVDDNGNPVEGALVRLSGTQNRKSITDANGNYRFDKVETTGFYTVTPSRTNYSFSPAERSFSQIGNTTEAAFTGSRVSTGVSAIETPEYFVRQHYLDFLGREPDEAGFNFWSDQILECGSDVGCLERRRINVSAAYFLSIEFQETGGLVDGLYRASYGRRPLYAEFMPDTRAVARGVVVGRAGWAQQLEANKQAFVDAWVQNATFLSIFGSLNNEAYADELIAHTGVAFSQGERDSLVSGLDSGTSTRANVLRQIAENDRFVNAKRNKAFVMMQYFGYLRRDPDESGYQFWLRKLNQFHGNFEQAEMVKAFLVSGEYRQRFGQP